MIKKSQPEKPQSQVPAVVVAGSGGTSQEAIKLSREPLSEKENNDLRIRLINSADKIEIMSLGRSCVEGGGLEKIRIWGRITGIVNQTKKEYEKTDREGWPSPIAVSELQIFVWCTTRGHTVADLFNLFDNASLGYSSILGNFETPIEFDKKAYAAKIVNALLEVPNIEKVIENAESKSNQWTR